MLKAEGRMSLLGFHIDFLMTYLNIAGLVMNMFGVIMLFFFGMPFRTRTGGYSSYVVEDRNSQVVRAEA